MNTYLMDLRDICRSVGFKKTTIYKWINVGEFPKSVKIEKSVRWVSTEVEAWLAEKELTGSFHVQNEVLPPHGRARHLQGQVPYTG